MLTARSRTMQSATFDDCSGPLDDRSGPLDDCPMTSDARPEPFNFYKVRDEHQARMNVVLHERANARVMQKAREDLVKSKVSSEEMFNAFVETGEFSLENLSASCTLISFFKQMSDEFDSEFNKLVLRNDSINADYNAMKAFVCRSYGLILSLTVVFSGKSFQCGNKAAFEKATEDCIEMTSSLRRLTDLVENAYQRILDASSETPFNKDFLQKSKILNDENERIKKMIIGVKTVCFPRVLS